MHVDNDDNDEDDFDDDMHIPRVRQAGLAGLKVVLKEPPRRRISQVITTAPFFVQSRSLVDQFC